MGEPQDKQAGAGPAAREAPQAPEGGAAEPSPKPPQGAAGGADGATIERVEVDAAGRLVVHLAGRDEPLVDAKVARCFPWSLPGRYVSILDKDGKEIALLETLEGLNEQSRRVVQEQLATTVFNPVIRRVIGHKHEFGITSITAETDRGTVTFQVRSRDDVRTLSPTRALFRDADGNVYELPDVTRLDAASRKHLEHYF
jgi:hypothetical protein